VNSIAGLEQSLETGEDGRAVLEIVIAAYASAGTGRKVTWPREAPRDKRPIELWRG
jgi:hypothetical protein